MCSHNSLRAPIKFDVRAEGAALQGGRRLCAYDGGILHRFLCALEREMQHHYSLYIYIPASVLHQSQIVVRAAHNSRAGCWITTSGSRQNMYTLIAFVYGSQLIA